MVPPLPIPNRAVKRASAYDTRNSGKIGHRRGTLEQNRAVNTVFNNQTKSKPLGFFVPIFSEWEVKTPLL